MDIAALIISLVAAVGAILAAIYAKKAPQMAETLRIETEKRNHIRGHLSDVGDFMADAKKLVLLKHQRPLREQDVPGKPREMSLQAARQLADELTNADEVEPHMEQASAALHNVTVAWGMLDDAVRYHVEQEERANAERAVNNTGLRFDTGRAAVDDQLDALATWVEQYEKASAAIRQIFTRVDQGKGVEPER